MGSKQYITLWRDLDDVSVEIKTNENLLDWFQCNIEKAEVGINAEIKNFEGPLQFSPTKRRCHPTVRNRGIEDANPPIVPSKNIHTHKKVVKDAKKVKEKGEHDSETESVAALSDSSYDSGLVASSDSNFEYDPDAEIIEDDYDDVPIFSYDCDDPCIDVGVVFPDVDQCQVAVQHWCIMNDHAYHTIKKDKGRFIANCLRASTGCKWIFFASTSKKEIGCKVNIALFVSLFLQSKLEVLTIIYIFCAG
jgi:hypothetical protein